MNDERNTKDLLNDFDLMLSGYIASVNKELFLLKKKADY